MAKISLENFQRLDESLFQKQLQDEWQLAYGSLKKHEIARKAAIVGREAMKWLMVLAVLGGVVTVALVAPKVFVLFGGDRRMYVNDDYFNRQLSYMRRKKYITIDGESDKLFVKPTKLGKFWLFRKFIASLLPNERKAKDGRIRIVIFDIPRKHNAERNIFRKYLRKIGLERLQASVYLARFACEEKVIFVANVLNVFGFVNIIYADSIERID